MSEIIKQQTACSECNNKNLFMDHEAGELVCPNCGFVISMNQINRGPEWRAFDPAEREKLPRAGAPLSWTMHDMGLSTTISWENKDYSGRKLGQEERYRLYRLRKWHNRSKLHASNQRNLAYALSEMSKIGNKINLPKNVIETSSIIYRQALQKKLIRGRTIQSIVVASLYMACRQCGVIRTLEEVANAANITKKDAARNYRFLFNKLKTTVPQTNPSGYISKIVNNLELNGETEQLALKILTRVSELRLTCGRGPGGTAAACVYISSHVTGDRRTQSEIAREAQVTEVTIRNRYKELTRRLNIKMIL